MLAIPDQTPDSSSPSSFFALRHNLPKSDVPFEMIARCPAAPSMDLSCVHCHVVVRVELGPWREGEVPSTQRWTCPRCQQPNEATLLLRIVRVGLGRDWSAE